MRVQHFRWAFGGLLALIWAGAIALADTPVILGLSVEKSNGHYRFTGGTAPWALGVAVVVAGLYLLLMNAPKPAAGKPLPGVFRRYVAFWLDFVFAMSVATPLVGIWPAIFEWGRTSLFVWTFERGTPADGDIAIAVLSSVLTSLILLVYFAIPLARRRPSPGACIMGYLVVPDDGENLTTWQIVGRTLLGFVAACSAWIAPFVGRDRKKGKFWLDRKFGTRAVLLH